MVPGSSLRLNIVGRDILLKLMTPDFYESLFVTRRKYFINGKPRNLGENSTIYFLFKKSDKEGYDLVGSAKPIGIRKADQSDRDEGNFSEENKWNLVIDLKELTEYRPTIPSNSIFSEATLKKINSRRPFGIELEEREAKNLRVVTSKFRSHSNSNYA